MKRDLRASLIDLAADAGPLVSDWPGVLRRTRKRRLAKQSAALIGTLSCVALAILGAQTLSRSITSVPPSTAASPGVQVPGTFAEVDGRRFENLYVGQYLGTLPMRNGGCVGGAGGGATRDTSGKGALSVSITTDSQCRVFVTEIVIDND